MVDLKTPNPRGSALRDSDYAELEKSWLDRVTVDGALLRRVDEVEGADIVGKKLYEGNFGGIVFPYLWPGVDPNMAAAGTQTRYIHSYRIRRDLPEIRVDAGGARRVVGKYMAAPGSGNRLYFHPSTPPELLRDDNIPLVIVEGEKKTLACWRLAWHELPEGVESPRFLPVGLSGVFNWRGKVGKEDAPNGGKQTVKGPIPDLDRLEWHGRKVIILFDSNVSTNDAVKAARAELARHLYYDRHAQVHFATLPSVEGVNGIDDFLAVRGPEKALRLIDGAREKKFRDTPEADKSEPDKDERLAKIFERCTWIQTPNEALFAVVEMSDGRRETMGIRSRAFTSYLMRRAREIDGKAPTTQTVGELRALAESEADAARADTPVHLRVARAGEAVMVDLANASWEAVAITADGYTTVQNPPVHFRRARTQAAQVIPVSGGSLESLKRWCNCESQENFVLVCAWLVGALAPTGPYPVLNIRGEQGSAKSTTSKILRLLVDPAGRPENYFSGAIKSLPKDERDLMISANGSWVLVFDNTSGIKAEMSDCLCRLSTGGAFSTRQLHSDAEEMVFEAMRPLILNGIDDMATMPDLVDRSLMIDLPAIPEEGRRAESDFWREFETARPGIVGALYAAVSAALKHGPTVKLDRMPRMADFAKWVVGACRGGALPFTADQFLEVYFGNRTEATSAAIEASPLATQLDRMVRELGRWDGTAAELLACLNGRAGEAIQHSKLWPKDVRAVGNKVRRVAPLLRSAGISVQLNIRTGKSRSRVMVFEAPNTASSGNDVRQRPHDEMVF